MYLAVFGRIYVFLCISMSLSMYIYTYIYIYICYVYTHICIYIYIYNVCVHVSALRYLPSPDLFTFGGAVRFFPGCSESHNSFQRKRNLMQSSIV